jgi:hypothetical protein
MLRQSSPSVATFERLLASVPHGHWKTITFVAGLRHDGIVAPFVIDGSMNGPIFLAYIEQCLAPTLGRRDMVIMDNLPTHKVAGVVEAIEAVGASVLYLPSYSPDLNGSERKPSLAMCKGRSSGDESA